MTISISIDLPDELFQHLQDAANRSQRSVEAVLIDDLRVLAGISGDFSVDEHDTLLDRADDLLILRSKALAILKERGHDISSYLVVNT